MMFSAGGRGNIRSCRPLRFRGSTDTRMHQTVRTSLQAALISATLLVSAGIPAETLTNAPCDLEVQRAGQTISRIYREWPLRPSSDSVSLALQAITDELARRSTATSRRWRTHVVRDKNLNAFSIGDGHIFITEGMLRFVDSETELVALIAHEFGHHLAGHFCNIKRKRGFWGGGEQEGERHSIGTLQALVDPALERAADETAIQLLARAGYDPHATLTLAARMAAVHTEAHFQNRSRIQALKTMLPRYRFASTSPQDSAAFVQLKDSLAASGEVVPASPYP